MSEPGSEVQPGKREGLSAPLLVAIGAGAAVVVLLVVLLAFRGGSDGDDGQSATAANGSEADEPASSSVAGSEDASRTTIDGYFSFQQMVDGQFLQSRAVKLSKGQALRVLVEPENMLIGVMATVTSGPLRALIEPATGREDYFTETPYEYIGELYQSDNIVNDLISGGQFTSDLSEFTENTTGLSDGLDSTSNSSFYQRYGLPVMDLYRPDVGITAEFSKDNLDYLGSLPLLTGRQLFADSASRSSASWLTLVAPADGDYNIVLYAASLCRDDRCEFNVTMETSDVSRSSSSFDQSGSAAAVAGEAEIAGLIDAQTEFLNDPDFFPADSMYYERFGKTVYYGPPGLLDQSKLS